MNSKTYELKTYELKNSNQLEQAPQSPHRCTHRLGRFAGLGKLRLSHEHLPPCAAATWQRTYTHCLII